MSQTVSFPGLGLEFHFSSVAFTIGSKPIYWYGIVITLGILLAIAYASKRSQQFGVKSDDLLDMMLFVLPMWINFTLRIVALKEVLTMIEGNLSFHPFLNTVIGMTYDFLPFMILPLYTTLSKLDKSLLEAASDLGAGKAAGFLKVTVPLSVPGIISGVTMVFLPAMTNYVILDMLYNSTYIMGSLIGSYFHAYDWHSGSMISIVLLIIIFIITAATNGFSDENNSRGAVL